MKIYFHFIFFHSVLYFSFFFFGYCRSGIHQLHFVLVLFTFLHLLIYKLNLNQKNIVHVHEVHTFHFKHYPIGSICVGLMILGLFVTLYVDKSLLNITASLFFPYYQFINFYISQVFTTPAHKHFLLALC